MASFLAAVGTVLMAWAVITILAALTRRLREAESPILRAASLVTAGAGIWLTYDLVRFLLVG